MADDTEMTPVAAEPPKINPFAKPGPMSPTKPGATVALKPGLKLPTKPGATVALKPGLKLPPKPGATVALKPGLKLPTQSALKSGLKLPAKPVIRKPGSTVVATPLPKPVMSTAEAPTPAATPAPVASSPTDTVVAAPVNPVAIDAQGVGKLPTVDMKAVDRADAIPSMPEQPKPIEQLKSVTQKLKGITQEIPQQAILRKTGIIAEGAMSEAQKEAAKHKTARISLSDAMGVAPVKNENAPMKTIRIKRPIDIPNATAQLTPQPKTPTVAATPVAAPAVSEVETKPATTTTSASTITQRKTLKIARPGGGAVRPSGKFNVKRPSQAVTVSSGEKSADVAEGGAAADIADIPEMPVASIPHAAASAGDGPAWLWTLSAIVQAAACVAMGALAWFLYQNTLVNYF